MTTQPQYLILARILRPHGVRGDFSVQMITAFPERLNTLETIYLAKDPEDPKKVTIQTLTWARHNKGDQWLIHLEGIDSREDADRFRSQFLLVALDQAVPLEDDEVYLFQVMGLEVRTLAGESLGHVTDLIETGANDVYVVTGGPRGEVLIPAIPDVVLNIDVDSHLMTVQLPNGLLSENDDLLDTNMNKSKDN